MRFKLCDDNKVRSNGQGILDILRIPKWTVVIAYHISQSLHPLSTVYRSLPCHHFNSNNKNRLLFCLLHWCYYNAI